MKLDLIVDQFRDKRILVIGDVMLDKYIIGDVNRINPEAPVQIVSVSDEKYVPGGAANTANNIDSLGGYVTLIGVCGDDPEANKLESLLGEVNPILIREKSRKTTQKIRVVSQNQQLLRVDYEDTHPILKQTEEKILRYVLENINDYDCIVISDYAKGLVTQRLVNEINSVAKSKNVIVDPRPDHREFYKGVYLITPNLKEGCELLGLDYGKDPGELGRLLVDYFGSNILLTLGKDGMALFELNGSVKKIPTSAREVYDVSGAGDTVVATTALSLASDADLAQAARIANYAAGIVIGKTGTSTTNIDELKKEIG
jgi:D-glycero-beta-D-manno-heptose-7-phosphate kinase